MEVNNRVLLGMSGGIDSSMSAVILKESGFEVLGISFQFSGSDEQCEANFRDARLLANRLNIPHLIVDLREEFQQTIIRYFINEYLQGRTPFPCAYCNPRLKFYYLEKYANENNCYYISTGHYVKTRIHKGDKYLYSGDDPDKDQSFFLWGLKREIVDRLIFPLGEYKKTEIRDLASEKGFAQLSVKKDSLGICFIEGNNYRKFLKENGIQSTPGNFIYHNGDIVGRHTGIVNYTIGQRRGLGLDLNFPVFVSEIRVDCNEIVLAKYEDLYRKKIYIIDYYLIDKEVVVDGFELTVKVRYRLQETPCKLHILDESRAEVELLKPEAMISPGQTAVFYDGNRLVGGGFIKSTE